MELYWVAVPPVFPELVLDSFNGKEPNESFDHGEAATNGPLFRLLSILSGDILVKTQHLLLNVASLIIWYVSHLNLSDNFLSPLPTRPPASQTTTLTPQCSAG